MEIEVFDVVQITEPDFGCEDSGREKRSVLLKLIPEGSREDATYVEMTEEDLVLFPSSNYIDVERRNDKVY